MERLPLPALHVSGLLVAVQAGRLDEVARQVPGVAGASVEAHDTSRSRLVVTIEGDTVEALEESGALMARLPGVLSVSPVCHFVAAGDER